MGIFSALFGKKKVSLKNHKVFMTRAEANYELVKYIAEQGVQGKKAIVAYFFKETRSEIENLLQGAPVTWVNLAQAGFIPGANENAVVILAETGMDYDREQKIFEMLEQNGYNQKVPVYDSLEDPVFIHFGADRIRRLMQMMGIKPGECIEHRTVNTSIDRVQQKLKQKNVQGYKTDSRTEMVRMMEGMKEK